MIDSVSTLHYQLYETKEFADVTLISDDYQTIEAHKTMLGHSSIIFRTLLHLSSDQKPIIFLKGVEYKELLALVKLIYLGKASLAENELISLFEVAKEYKINLLNFNDEKDAQTKAKKLDFLPQASVKEHEPHGNIQINKLNFLNLATNFKHDSVNENGHESFEVENELMNSPEVGSPRAKGHEDITQNNKEDVSNIIDPNLKERIYVTEMSQDQNVEVSDLENDPSNKMCNQKIRKVEEQSECTVCAKTFTTLRSLQRHTKIIHELAFNEKCEKCGMTFNSRYGLKDHIKRVHDPPIYFSCDKCNWKTKQRHAAVMRRHKIQHHQLSCDFCKISFEKDEEFYAHIKRDHINKYVN